MTTIDFITQLSCCVGNKLTQHDKNQECNQANFYPSEIELILMHFEVISDNSLSFWRIAR